MADSASPSIAEVMTTEVITVDRSQALSEVYDLFESRSIHHLPVMDGQRPVGMVSATDVLRLVYDIDRLLSSRPLKRVTRLRQIKQSFIHLFSFIVLICWHFN